MRGRYKAWAPSLLKEHPEYVFQGEKDPFLDEAKELEIGAGKGSFAIQMAKKGHVLLALERDISCAGLFLKKLLLEEESLPLRIFPVDFDDALPILGKKKFTKIYLNFSDPWPKKKHEKRRLFYPPRFSQIGNLLDRGGEIYIKTDNDDLYSYALKCVEPSGFFTKKRQDIYENVEQMDAMSEYEANFRKEGKNIHRLILGKEN